MVEVFRSHRVTVMRFEDLPPIGYDCLGKKNTKGDPFEWVVHIDWSHHFSEGFFERMKGWKFLSLQEMCFDIIGIPRRSNGKWFILGHPFWLWEPFRFWHMGVSKNMGTPKSSILIGFPIIFTIHFGAPLFLEIPIKMFFGGHFPNWHMVCLRMTWICFSWWFFYRFDPIG